MDQEAAVSSEQIGQLCRACGLCCDGSLFSWGQIDGEDDWAVAAGLGFSFVDEGGKHSLSLPCRHFSGTCTIYGQQRPRVCSDFFCYPIRQLKRGELAFEQVQSLLEQAVMLQRRFVRACGSYPELAGKPVHEVCRHLELVGIPHEEQMALRRRYAPLLLLSTKLIPLLNEMSFRARPDKT